MKTISGSKDLPVVVLPDDTLDSELTGIAANIVKWDWVGAAPEKMDIVVPPYLLGPEILEKLRGKNPWVVQSASIGYDGVSDHLPKELRFANAASVHEASTAELTVGLILASLRGIPEFVNNMRRSKWLHGMSKSLADRKVLVVGVGGVGGAIIDRLLPFETEITRVGFSERTENGHTIHSINNIYELLPCHDIVVLAVPLTDETRGLVGEDFLRQMSIGSLLVNISRGPVVETDALVKILNEGRIFAALDVTDPEPLPEEHPLWRAPNVLISPHVGGSSSAMIPRLANVIKRQVERFTASQEPINLINF